MSFGVVQDEWFLLTLLNPQPKACIKIKPHFFKENQIFSCAPLSIKINELNFGDKIL